MAEELVVKLEGLDICDLFYPVALLFQVIYLLLHVVEFTIGSVKNVGDVASRSSLEGGGVIEVIGNVQALTTMSSVWSAASSLRLLTSSSTRSWMELSPLIKFEMVAKASLCMFIDRPSWTMQSIDPLCAFFGQLCFDETEEMLHKTVSA